jgi:hypothetical protein
VRTLAAWPAPVRARVSEMYRVRRFGVIKTATAAAATFFVGAGVVFLIGGLLFSAVFLGSTTTVFSGPDVPEFGQGTQFLLPGLLAGLLAVLAVYSVVVWVGVAIFCLIYNFIGRHGGGIEIELQPVEPPAMVAPWGPPQPRDAYGWDYGNPSGPSAGWPGAPGPSQRPAAPQPPPWGAPVPPPDTSPWAAPPSWRG